MWAVVQLSAGHLIIAMPQSSSTSLENDVARASMLSHTQEFPCNRKTASIWNASFSGMHVHSDTCTLSPSLLNRWIFSQSRVFKQHVVPGRSNSDVVRAALNRRARIVYLTRDPVHAGHAVCERLLASHRALDAAAIKKKVEAMRLWRAEWDVVFRNTDGVLRVTYDDLRRNNSQVVRSILDFWNLKMHDFNHSTMRLVNRTSERCSGLGR